MIPQRQIHIVVVEDDAQMKADIEEFLGSFSLEDVTISFEVLDQFSEAAAKIREKKVDLLILDVFHGRPMEGGSPAGIEVLEQVKTWGFVPVILYTAHPEGVRDAVSPFVRLVGKDFGGLEALSLQISELDELGILRLYRGIVNHVDNTLRQYMWGFVEANWSTLKELAGTAEFPRIILRRLSASLSRDGVEEVVALMVDGDHAPPAENTVHPVEYYIMPPIAPDSILMGDIRVRDIGGQRQFLVVLWPSCDMVEIGTRKPKTDRLLCAVAEDLEHVKEVAEWRQDGAKGSGGKFRDVDTLLRNKIDRYHFLPALCNIPNLRLDFQRVEVVPLDVARAMKCLATLASPFAESVASRYLRYIGRLGTPDLDLTTVFSQLKSPQ